MSQPKNRQALVDVEYLLDQYFSHYYVPVIKSETERLRQEAEAGRKADPALPVWDYEGSPYRATIVAEGRGAWKRKTTEDLLESCSQHFKNDPKIEADLEVLTGSVMGVLIDELGVKAYKKLSKDIGQDLAGYYVENRFKTLFAEQLGKMKAPKNSFDYIFGKGVEDSFHGLYWVNHKPTDLDDQIKAYSEKAYNPNLLEKLGALGVSLGIDGLTFGGYGTVAKGAVTASSDITIRMLLPEGSSGDEALGEVLLGDKKALDSIRKEAKSVNPQNSERLLLLNGALNKKVFIPKFNEEQYKATAKQFTANLPADKGDVVVERLKAGLDAVGFKPKDHVVPKWMGSKSDKELYQNAASFSALAITMRLNGVDKKNVGGKILTADEIAQRGYDYACALSAYQHKVQSEVNQYVEYQQQVIQENQAKIEQNNQVIQQKQAELQQAAFVQQQQFAQQVTGQQSAQDVAGWGGLLDQFGLGGFGDIGRNLGYVIGMLPDMLIGMFTGKTRNLKFKDNLMPIAAIIMGLFVRNPILKMLLVGLGGANLLNKAGKEVLENARGQAQPVRQYQSYMDEPLNPRMKQSAMRGNTMIVTIDNVPSVITINDEAVNAYEKGLVPLNVLANRVLQLHDQQQLALREQYDRQVGQEETQVVHRGLK